MFIKTSQNKLIKTSEGRHWHCSGIFVWTYFTLSHYLFTGELIIIFLRNCNISRIERDLILILIEIHYEILGDKCLKLQSRVITYSKSAIEKLQEGVKICSKLTIKTPIFTPFCSVSITDFKSN